MQRALARVVDLKRISEGKTAEGFMLKKVLLKVRVEQAGAQGFRLPPRTKGRVHWIVRETVGPWTIRKGDRVVLDTREVMSLLHPLQLEPTIAVPERDKVNLSLSLYSPVHRRDLSWEVEAGSLGGKAEGCLGRGGLSRVALKIGRAEKGAHLVTAACGGHRTSAVIPVVRRGTVLSYSLDMNGDGFEEVVLENDYLRVVTMPHLGARLGNLYYKPTRRDRFSSHLEYGREGYIEHGGSHDILGHEPPGELWNAEFKVADVGDSWVVQTHKSKGLEVRKRIEVLPSLPIVHQTVTVSSNVAGEKEVVYWHRVPLAVGERSWREMVVIPTKDGVERIRHYPPYGWHRLSTHFGLKFGGCLFHNEEERESLLCLTEPGKIECATVTFSRKSLICLLRREAVTLRRGESVSYGTLYVLGDQYSLQEDSLAMISVGEERRGSVPVILCLRNAREAKKTSAKLSSDVREQSIRLAGREFAGTGRIHVGGGSVPASGGLCAEILADGARHLICGRGEEDV